MYEDEKVRFERVHGYKLDLDNPKSFNEKVVYKKLFDRDPLLVLTSDKYRARDFIRGRIGWEADNHLIPLLWVGEKAEDIPLDELSDQYIIKPNNGAGRWIIAENKTDPHDKTIGWTEYTLDRVGTFVNLSENDLIRHCKSWFKTVHGAEWYEWCYGEIDPLIVVEKLLYDNGDIPYSYKLCMFNGKCKMIYALNRDDITISLYDENWKMLPVKRKNHPVGEVKEKPKSFDKMIDFAEKLSKGFDFVRVDFFLVGDHIYFGELTHYPGSGHGVFEPAEYDFELGEFWR